MSTLSGSTGWKVRIDDQADRSSPDVAASIKADQPRVPTGRRAGRWMIGIRTEHGHKRAVSSSQAILGTLLESAGSDMAMASVENPDAGTPAAETAEKSEERTARTTVRIQKFDRKTNIVYGVVYAPGELDNQGEVMFAPDIEVLAHRFMELDLSSAIDTQHDGVPNGCRPVESFIAREGDPDYPAGAWVMGVRVTEDIAYRVEKGDINGFSFDALVKHTPVDVVYDVIRDHVGDTEPHEDHSHLYFLQLDDAGKIVRGQTDVVNGHSHAIKRASVTEAAGDHVHRFFMQ